MLRNVPTTVLQDIRYAVRQLRHSPNFTLTAVIVLALGIGANIAVFTLVDGILLRPLPYAQPDRIVAIAGPVNQGFAMEWSYANMRQLCDAVGATVKTGVLLNVSNASVVGPGGRFQVEDVAVTANLIGMLGVQPILGRSFRTEENDPGHEHVVMLGEDVWRKLYASDAQIVGKTLTIRHQPYTIIGVMPRGFSFPFGDAMQIWSPAALDAASRTAMSGPHQVWGEMYARLPEGMTAAQLTANLNHAQALIAKEVPNANLPTHISVKAYQASLNEDAREPLALLYAVVFSIWVLACMNVTSLMLARAIARNRELSVRSALGASRMRLLQQSVVESLILSCVGSVVGLLAGKIALKLLWHSIEQNLPLTSAVHVEWRVIAVLVVLTLLTTLIVGLIPALQATRRDLQNSLHGVNNTASVNQSRTREVLVVAQLALTVLFLVSAGLFLRTIHALRQVPLGFHEQNVLTGGISFHNDASHMLANPTGATKQTNFILTTYLPLLDRLRAIPGVSVAALSSVLPMRPNFAVFLSTELDHKDVPQGQEPHANGRLASAGLADALGISMVQGRFFTDEDTNTTPVVVVVNQAFVNRYLSGTDPIGHIISLGKTGRFADAHIVGVIGDMKQFDVTKATRPEMYFCLAQIAPGTPLYGIATAFMEVAIRGAVPADSLRVQFEKALHEVAPDATTTDVESIHEAVEDSFSGETLTTYLLAGFAVLALLIASVGLYGLLSFVVAQRTRELGLRIALGAQQGDILRLVLRRAVVLVIAGLFCGIATSWFAVSLARSYLYGVQMHDSLTFILVVMILAAISLFAAWLPARRAASIDPMQALRSE